MTKPLASDYPFESFNARALSPRQVAGGFVPPETFRKLSKRRHTIIAGPRGSGKTTLLKMLQVSALRSWTHPEADEYRRQIDFTGVFVPADRCWSEQLSAIGKDHLNPQQRQLLGIAAFTTQILRALVSAVIERKADDEGARAKNFRRLNLTSQQEINLAQTVAPLWALPLEVPTLLGLRLALSQRLSDIHTIASQCAFHSMEESNALLAATRGLHLNFLSAVPLFLDVLEAETGVTDERWALLFDELELAPESIRASLSQALRSVDQRLLFKLSIAPFSRELEENVRAASDRNDFDLVRLWYPSKEDGYEFSRSLMLHMLQRRGFTDSTLEHVFGTTDYEPSQDSKRKAQGTVEYHLNEAFRRLAARDSSFRDYLAERSIDLNSSHKLSENEHAAHIRKISALVIVRETFRGDDETGEVDRGGLRSRKARQIYCGVPALLAVCEGNPRWLIGIVDSLLDHATKDRRVPKHYQDSELSSLQSRFSAFLRTIPGTGFDGKAGPSSVLGLVDTIGARFRAEIVQKRFNPDPPGSFIVDSHATDEQLRTLEQAIYAGAIVFVPESDNEIAVGSLRGKRFRLAYLLAPKFKLPMILLRPKSLSSLLNLKSDLSGEDIQKGLF